MALVPLVPAVSPLLGTVTESCPTRSRVFAKARLGHFAARRRYSHLAMERFGVQCRFPKSASDHGPGSPLPFRPAVP